MKTPPICAVGSKDQKKCVADLLRIRDDFRLQLQSKFKEMLDYWKVYFLKRVDARNLPAEDWRAFTTRPTPFSTIETLVAVSVDLTTSPDPMIQAEGEGAEDSLQARGIERELDYALRRNKFSNVYEAMQREKRVQGISIGRVGYGKGPSFKLVYDFKKDFKAFRDAVKTAERHLRVKAPIADDDLGLIAFEAWRKSANEQLKGKVSIPEIPTDSVKVKTLYEGPTIERVNVFMTAFDPTIETIQGQRYFFRDVPVLIKDLKKFADDKGDSEKPYSLTNIKAAEASSTESDYDGWNKALAAVTGITGHEMYSAQKGVGMITEVWCADEEYPLIQILNERTIINKHPDLHPYNHGMKPFFYLVNTPVNGQFIGLSELAPTKDVFNDENRLAELAMDAVVLNVLPIYSRLMNSGVNLNTMGGIRPGTFIDVKRHDALSLLNKMNPGIIDAFREMGSIRDTIDDTHATWGNVRGAGASVGRVSATDSVNRMNQALVRQKIHAQRDETNLQDLVHLVLGVMYQFMDGDRTHNIAGQQIVLNRERFVDALTEDYKFRGATKAFNKAEKVQSLINFAKTFANHLRATEMRRTMKEVLDTEGVKFADQIVTPEGTQFYVQQEQMAAMQAMGAAMPQPGAPMPGGPPEAPPEAGPGSQGVNPAPDNQGQALPLALLQMMAAGRLGENRGQEEAPPA